MSPMLTALIVGWAVITVIVIAVSVIAIRGQRHGAEDEEVLIPWGSDQQQASETPKVSAYPATAPIPVTIPNTQKTGHPPAPILKPVTAVETNKTSIQPIDTQEPNTHAIETPPQAVNDQEKAVREAKRRELGYGTPATEGLVVKENLPTNKTTERPLAKNQPSNKPLTAKSKVSLFSDSSEHQDNQDSQNLATTESLIRAAQKPLGTQSNKPLAPIVDSVPEAELFISGETRFVRILKEAISPELNIWRSLTHQDLTDADKVVPIGNDGQNKTGLEHAPTLYSLHLKDSFSPLCLIHIEKKKSLTGKLIGRKSIEQVRKLAADKKLPLIRIDYHRQYNKAALQELLAFHLPDRLLSSREHLQANEPHSHYQSTDKICPRCSSSMSKKIATRGKHAGTRFWACNSYPDCRQVEVIHRENTLEAHQSS